MNIPELLSLDVTERISFSAQITALERKQTKEGNKPYFDVELGDGLGTIKLKAWGNSNAFHPCTILAAGDCVKVEGSFARSDYGMESKDWKMAKLSAEEEEQLLAGSPERRGELADYCGDIHGYVNSMTQPTLRWVCEAFLTRYAAQFQRAAAARGNHHARRGGLLEHTREMIRLAWAIQGVYPQRLNRDLLIAGALFHDSGKLVENQYEARGFTMPFRLQAELYGHIAIGVQFVKTLLAEAPAEDPQRELVGHLLCHLILSHHGELAWGSPVEPRFPEAQVLHYVDQISAKLEMMHGSYAAPEAVLALDAEGEPQIIKPNWPMKVNLVRFSLEPAAEIQRQDPKTPSGDAGSTGPGVVTHAPPAAPEKTLL